MGKLLKKIIWSVDPLGNEKGLQLRTAAALRGLIQGAPAHVEPVHVLSAAALGINPTHLPDWEDHYLPSAVTALEYIVKRSKIPGIAPPRLIVEESGSLRNAVAALITHARRRKADLIVVGTHARRGLDRLVSGSFVETLVLHSPIPVLAVNLGAPELRRPRHILFPTDLDRSSRRAFSETVRMAKRLGASLTLLHKVVVPVDVNARVLFEYERAVRKANTLTANAWARWARRQGVKARAIVDDGAGDAASTVVRAAKRAKAGLVAMASHKGPVEAAILGSVTRQVLRQAGCPVWILHTA
jgi:nucleotide-binding universal stress UspA family protein